MFFDTYDEAFDNFDRQCFFGDYMRSIYRVRDCFDGSECYCILPWSEDACVALDGFDYVLVYN